MTAHEKNTLQELEQKAIKAFRRSAVRLNRQLLKSFENAARSPKPGLASFNTAAQRLLKAEASHAARPRWEKLSLLHYLHSAEHVAARRALTAEQEKLHGQMTENGQSLTRAVDRAIPSAVTSVWRRTPGL